MGEFLGVKRVAGGASLFIDEYSGEGASRECWPSPPGAPANLRSRCGPTDYMIIVTASYGRPRADMSVGFQQSLGRGSLGATASSAKEGRPGQAGSNWTARVGTYDLSPGETIARFIPRHGDVRKGVHAVPDQRIQGIRNMCSEETEFFLRSDGAGPPLASIDPTFKSSDRAQTLLGGPGEDRRAKRCRSDHGFAIRWAEQKVKTFNLAFNGGTWSDWLQMNEAELQPTPFISRADFHSRLRDPHQMSPVRAEPNVETPNAER